MEENQQKALEQRCTLERLQVEKELKIAQAKLDAYNRLLQLTSKEVSTKQRLHLQRPLFQCLISQFPHWFKSSKTLNRLPVAEPFVFHCDPIQFVKWKASFTSFVDRSAIAPAEKLY